MTVCHCCRVVKTKSCEVELSVFLMFWNCCILINSVTHFNIFYSPTHGSHFILNMTRGTESKQIAVPSEEQLPQCAERDALTVTLTICISLFSGYCSGALFGAMIINCMNILFLIFQHESWKMKMIKENKNKIYDLFLLNCIVLLYLLNIFCHFPHLFSIFPIIFFPT